MLNHGQVLAEVSEAIEQARAESGRCGVLVIRPQRLRETEQMLGFAAIERLLGEAWSQLEVARRPVDRLIRIGEGDVAMVVPNLRNPQHIELAAAKVARLLGMPLDVDGVPVRLTHAIGAALWRGDGEDAQGLCLRAEAACNLARKVPRHFVVSAESSEHVPIGYDDLFLALRNNTLQVFLQPIHRVDDGTLTGFESLARWQDPTLGWVPPEQFVSLAEKTRLIGELTRWSLNATLRACAPALAANPALTCSVNLSAELIQDLGIVEQIEAVLQTWNVAPASLVVEVTETGFVSSTEQVSEVLHGLKRLGVAVAIDDFGAGFASWGYLQYFPVDYLKIDGGFIRAMGQTPRSRQLVSAMIDLAHRIGAVAVAERVSSQEELEALRELGCDRYQGYLGGRPAPAVEVIAVLDKTGQASG